MSRKYYQLATEKLDTDTSTTEQFKQGLRRGIAERLKKMEGK